MYKKLSLARAGTFLVHTALAASTAALYYPDKSDLLHTAFPKFIRPYQHKTRLFTADINFILDTGYNTPVNKASLQSIPGRHNSALACTALVRFNLLSIRKIRYTTPCKTICPRQAAISQQDTPVLKSYLCPRTSSPDCTSLA